MRPKKPVERARFVERVLFALLGFVVEQPLYSKNHRPSGKIFRFSTKNDFSFCKAGRAV
jgi:hypothetical protein